MVIIKTEWIHNQDNLLLVEGLARDGYTNEQIAETIGISTSTLYSWKKNYPSFKNAIENGKMVSDYRVEKVLYEKALNGDMTAIIFWLKNRQPKKWNEKVTKENGYNNEYSVFDLSDFDFDF